MVGRRWERVILPERGVSGTRPVGLAVDCNGPAPCSQSPRTGRPPVYARGGW